MIILFCIVSGEIIILRGIVKNSVKNDLLLKDVLTIINDLNDKTFAS